MAVKKVSGGSAKVLDGADAPQATSAKDAAVHFNSGLTRWPATVAWLMQESGKLDEDLTNKVLEIVPEALPPVYAPWAFAALAAFAPDHGKVRQRRVESSREPKHDLR